MKKALFDVVGGLFASSRKKDARENGNAHMFAARFVVAMLLMGAVLVSASCSKKGAAAVAGNAQSLEKFNIIADPNITSNPLAIIARERGYFQEEGLDPNFIFLRDGRTEALSTGRGDIYLEELIPPLVYASQGADVRIIGGALSGGNYVITKPENAQKYARLEDWTGARLGTVRLSTSEMVSRYALGKTGLDLNNDVTFQEIDSYPNIIEAVRKGQVDIGFIAGGPYRKSALELGLSILFPMNYMSQNYLCCRLNAYKPSLEAKRDAFVKFLQAYLRAYKDFNDLAQRDEIVKMFADLTSQAEEFVVEMVFDRSVNGERSYNPDPDLGRVINVWDTLIATDYIHPEGIAIKDVVDITVYKEALDNIVRRYPGETLFTELVQYYEENDLNI
ncbi:MAG: ABC transporter substrate-binding protein [Spirochaetaceae bacterium]|jgi:NitT/TauT family transport system substrate-binding protein|nr:ABC transporter substrate-binding protein [Spirochaetaceae bacterium]